MGLNQMGPREPQQKVSEKAPPTRTLGRETTCSPNETLRWGPEVPRVTSSRENSSDRRDRKSKSPARVT